MIYVKPKQGLRVRHPEQPTILLPKEGAWMDESVNLSRLINAGDVVVDKSKKQEDSPTAKHKPNSQKQGDKE